MWWENLYLMFIVLNLIFILRLLLCMYEKLNVLYVILGDGSVLISCDKYVGRFEK